MTLCPCVSHVQASGVGVVVSGVGVGVITICDSVALGDGMWDGLRLGLGDGFSVVLEGDGDSDGLGDGDALSEADGDELVAGIIV